MRSRRPKTAGRPADAPIGGAPNGSLTSTLPNLAFEPVPAGAMVPQAAPQPRLDPVVAERLLGPAPRSAATAVHTNLGDTAPARPKTGGEKVGRNDQCPCGSGKKYKRCHGTAA
jgi:preprotein translocase subunit SecA